MSLRILAQLVGAILGGLVAVDGLRDDTLNFAEKAESTSANALIFEIIFSFILILVFLRTRDSGVGPFAHGLCYTVAIFCGLNIFEGNPMINPASALGLMTGSSSHSDDTDESFIWVYLVGPFIGTLLAVLFYQFTAFFDNYNDKDTFVRDESSPKFVKTADRHPEGMPHHPVASSGVRFQQPSNGVTNSPRLLGSFGHVI